MAMGASEEEEAAGERRWLQGEDPPVVGTAWWDTQQRISQKAEIEGCRGSTGSQANASRTP